MTAAATTRAETNGSKRRKPLALLLAVMAILFLLQFVLPEYYHLTMTRIMILAIFAMGYNVSFGYAGLLSLGHAMFFAAGLYGAGLTASDYSNTFLAIYATMK